MSKWDGSTEYMLAGTDETEYSRVPGVFLGVNPEWFAEIVHTLTVVRVCKHLRFYKVLYFVAGD